METNQVYVQSMDEILDYSPSGQIEPSNQGLNAQKKNYGFQDYYNDFQKKLPKQNYQQQNLQSMSTFVDSQVIPSNHQSFLNFNNNDISPNNNMYNLNLQYQQQRKQKQQIIPSLVNFDQQQQVQFDQQQYQNEENQESDQICQQQQELKHNQMQELLEIFESENNNSPQLQAQEEEQSVNIINLEEPQAKFEFEEEQQQKQVKVEVDQQQQIQIQDQQQQQQQQEFFYSSYENESSNQQQKKKKKQQKRRKGSNCLLTEEEKRLKKNFFKNICFSFLSYIHTPEIKEQIQKWLKKEGINQEQFFRKYNNKLVKVNNRQQFKNLFYNHQSNNKNSIVNSLKQKSLLRFLGVKFCREEIVSYAKYETKIKDFQVFVGYRHLFYEALLNLPFEE